MARCDYCGTSILFGGVREGNNRFCNSKCHQNGYILRVAQQAPADVLERETENIFRGNCPKCRGLGPIDVHKIHRVWSALILTNWSSSQQISCRSCGVKSQLGGAAFSLVLGWWGFPWGLILTPVQIARNIAGMCSRKDSSQPSPELRKLVQVMVGLKMIQASRQNSGAAPPVIPGAR